MKTNQVYKRVFKKLSAVRATLPTAERQVLDNITAAAQVRPLVIQSLFMRVNGAPPPVSEIDAFIARLREITAAGGRLKLVQIYTVARPPAIWPHDRPWGRLSPIPRPASP